MSDRPRRALELILLALAAAGLAFQLVIDPVVDLRGDGPRNEAFAPFNASCDVLFIALCVRVLAAFRGREVAPISR